LETVKRSSRDEPILVVIYIFMETTQRISLYSYIHLKLAKMLCFSFYLTCFFFNKIGEQEGGTGSAKGRGGDGPKNVSTCK
jgi:hypothetical protein